MHEWRLRGERVAVIRKNVRVGVVAVLVFAVLLAAALTALLPVQRPPFSGLAFSVGFPAGELAGQLLALTVALSVALAVYGWPHGLLGATVIGLAVVAAVAFAFLLSRGLRAMHRVDLALATAHGVAVSVPSEASRHWLAWWRTVLAVPIRGRHVKVRRDIAYLDDDRRAHRLDVITSRAAAVDGAPVMLFVHGGAWVVGSKREQGLPMLFELAARGWVCVTINYRLSPKATWPDQMVDVKRAIAWTKAHAAEFGGDTSKFLAISGASAGGHLAALAALTPGDPEWQPGFEDLSTDVDACVALYGVLEMTGDPELAGSQGHAIRRHLELAVFKSSLTDARDRYEQASPMHRITPGAPSFLVLHGTKDTLVPVGVARAFVRAFAAKASAPVCYVELPGAQHAFDVLCSPRSTATTLGIASFLEALVAARTGAEAA
jgi:acetyl esterase/lipase